MWVLDGELQCCAQLMRIQRAMAGLIQPLGVLGDEFGIADLFPGADACGIAVQHHGLGTRTILGCALGRQAHGHVGIAFAGAETVAEPDDKQVGDLDGILCDLLAADLQNELRS